MTKVFIIAVVMWWGDPAMIPENDSVEIKYLHGEPLYFLTEKECGIHIDDNLQALKDYGRSVYPTANAVKTILCVPEERNLGDQA